MSKLWFPSSSVSWLSILFIYRASVNRQVVYTDLDTVSCKQIHVSTVKMKRKKKHIYKSLTLPS